MLFTSAPLVQAMQHVLAQCVDILDGPIASRSHWVRFCLFTFAIRMVI